MMRRLTPLALLASGALACTGDLGSPPPTDPETEPEPILEPITVPASLTQVTGTGFCVTLDDGESFWSASPEGYAWLAKPVAEEQHVRVFDPFDDAAAVADELLLDEIRWVQAWSAGDAAVITAEGLWRLEDMARIQVTPPTDHTTATMCGDPGANGALLSGGQLHERRDDQWFVWDSGVTDSSAPDRLLSFEGECVNQNNETWMMAADGLLWKLLPSEVFTPRQFEEGAAAAATADVVAVLEAEQLLVGPGQWQPYLFDGITPNAMSASAGRIWLGAGGQLLRYDGEDFVEVTHDLAENIQHVHAHAGGAWIVGETTVCHVSTDPMLRVDGVRPYVRSKELSYPFTVVASEPSLTITAEIDGEAIELSPDETGALAGTARIDQIGWSNIIISADGLSRTIPVKRLPEITRSWSEDIQPIYESQCTGSDCHGSGTEGSPDLGTYDAWVQYAVAIRTRVVEAQTMPPPASRTEEWSEEQVNIIAEWLEGGMLP